MSNATAVKPRPVLTDGDKPASPNFRKILLETAASRAWQTSPRATDIDRGLRLVMAGEPITNDGANWLLRYMRATPRTATPSPARYPRPADVAHMIPTPIYCMVDGRRFKVTKYAADHPRAGQLSLREQLPNDATRYPRGADRVRILTLIATDWQAAAAEYGRKTTKCCKCHKLLTDDVSVASGAGPDCRAKYGIPTIQPTDSIDHPGPATFDLD